MKKIIFLTLSLFISLGVWGQSKISASQVLEKSISALSASKGLSSDFSIIINGRSSKGSLKSSGAKFTVTMPDLQVWYNGKDIYSYNKKAGETTLFTPTMQELAESNPLMYVRNAQGTYNAEFSSEKKSGKYIIDLNPKKKNSEIKKITLTVRSNDFIPEKLVVTPKSGQTFTITINQLKTGQSFAAAEFEYPKSKMPKVEIIDMR